RAADRRDLRAGCALVVGETVVELQPVRFVDRGDLPPATGLRAVRAGHEVAGPAADLEVVLLERRRPGRRAPPALELARVLPDPPDALEHGVVLGDDREGQRLGVLVRTDDGHSSSSVRMS